jgi:hypothetical protein
MPLSKLKKKCARKLGKEVLESLDDLLVIHFDDNDKPIRLEIKN